VETKEEYVSCIALSSSLGKGSSGVRLIGSNINVSFFHSQENLAY
jgi:hypothetical protein